MPRCVYWLPEYLFQQRGFSLRDIGLFAWLPFLFADIGSIVGGWSSGMLIAPGVAVVTSVPLAFALIWIALFGFL